jgi:hypothetical protein
MHDKELTPLPLGHCPLLTLLACTLALTSNATAQRISITQPDTSTSPPVSTDLVSVESLQPNSLLAPVASKQAFRRWSQLEGLQLDGVLPTISLPPLDIEVVQAEDQARAARFDKTLRYGIGRDIEINFDDGMIIPLTDGSLLWAIDIQLPGAISSRLHLTQLALPAGAQLVVYGSGAPEQVAGPFEGLGHNGTGELWTPSRPGSLVRLEYRIPNVKPHDDLSMYGFRIDRVIHGYRDPVVGNGGLELGTDPGAGSCHNDVTCFGAGDSNKKAVAGIGFINSDALFCSGTLLNNLDGDFAPYWMTANHCLSTNSTAQSAEIYWRYETASCNASPPAVSSVPQSAVCTLLSTGSASDYSLLRIEGAIPSTSLVWAGWSTAVPSNGTSGNCIHHPSGDFKRISFGTYSSSTSCGGGDHFRVNWTNGPTEPGSSGSPYFADGFGFVGQLHCGPSACGNESSDQYGSWNSTWPSVSSIFSAGAGDDSLDDNDTCATARFITEGQYNNLIVKIQDEDWYRVFIPSNQKIEVNATFTDAFGDLDLQLYSTCGGSPVATATSTTNNETLTYSNTGTSASYYLRAYLWDNDALQNYSMNYALSPANDDCLDATAVTDGVYFGTLSGATNDGSATCGFSSTSPDVWYSYQAPCDGTLTVSTCGTHDGPGQDQGVDTVLALYSSCGGSELVCDDDDNPQIACTGLDAGLLRDSAVQIPVFTGQTVRIRVANFNNGATGPFTLRVDCLPDPPANDDCANATVIGNGAFGGTLVGATNDGTASCGQSSSSPDVWYRYTASCTGTMTASTCGTHDAPGQDQGVDTVLSLFDGCGGTELGCDDDDNPQISCIGTDLGSFRDSAVAISVTAGQEVYIRIANFNSGSTGPFSLQVECVASGPNSGSIFCSGNLGNCPCGATGLVGHGCPNTNPNGAGARLVGTGNAQFSNDTFGLEVTSGAFNKPGIIIKGGSAFNYPSGNNTVPNSSGLFCVAPQQRGDLFFTSATGTATISAFQLQPFGSSALPAGSTTYYQYWFRDPGNTCQNPPASSAAFNFSNGVEVDWLN